MMAKGTLQIKYEKLVLDNLDLKERNKELEAELNWWHELINRHHKNRTCPDLKTYVENLQKRIIKLEDNLILIRKSKEIMEARRFAEQALKGK